MNSTCCNVFKEAHTRQKSSSHVLDQLQSPNTLQRQSHIACIAILQSRNQCTNVSGLIHFMQGRTPVTHQLKLVQGTLLLVIQGLDPHWLSYCTEYIHHACLQKLKNIISLGQYMSNQGCILDMDCVGNLAVIIMLKCICSQNYFKKLSLETEPHPFPSCFRSRLPPHPIMWVFFLP